MEPFSNCADGCPGPTGAGMFCSTCGKLKEPGSLRKVRLQGFIGTASTSPKMEKFWATGDPEVFDEP